MPPPSFLTLPRELRDAITETLVKSGHLTFLRTCHQLHEEGSAALNRLITRYPVAPLDNAATPTNTERVPHPARPRTAVPIRTTADPVVKILLDLASEPKSAGVFYPYIPKTTQDIVDQPADAPNRDTIRITLRVPAPSSSTSSNENEKISSAGYPPLPLPFTLQPQDILFHFQHVEFRVESDPPPSYGSNNNNNNSASVKKSKTLQARLLGQVVEQWGPYFGRTVCHHEKGKPYLEFQPLVREERVGPAMRRRRGALGLPVIAALCEEEEAEEEEEEEGWDWLRIV